MNKSILSFFFAAFVLFAVSCKNEAKSGETKPADATTTAAANPTDPAATPATPTEPEVDPNLPKTSIEFATMEHDFGTIKQDQKVTHSFKFKNSGKEPLIIASAKGSCGCTVPEWPKEPVAPGAEGEIKVEFNSGKKAGQQSKTVTIQANTDPNPTRLTIKANIDAPADAAAATPGAAPAAKPAGH